MADALPNQLLNSTQLGQILISGGIISGADANQRVQAVANAQASAPTSQRKLIGQMLVDAGLCNQADVDAGLDVQNTVRGELSQMMSAHQESKPQPDEMSAKQLNDLIQEAYTKYEQTHPNYRLPTVEHTNVGQATVEQSNIEKHIVTESYFDIPPTIGQPAPRIFTAQESADAERLLKSPTARLTPVESTERRFS